MRSWLLKYILKTLTNDEADLLTRIVLEKVHAAPITDILFVDERGVLHVDGKAIDIDKMRQLRDAARLALQNPALTLIRAQVARQASVLAAIKAETTRDLVFARAALWWGDEELKKLQILAQQENAEL